MYVFGIDIGGTQIKIGLFHNQQLIHKIIVQTNQDADMILVEISKIISQVANQQGINYSDIIGIGVGVPAQISNNGFVKIATNIGWKNKNVEEDLFKLTGIKVLAKNDASLAALGELWQGAAQKYQNAIVLTLGTGVGSGLIVDGELYCGANGFSGEIGHMCINFDEEQKCHCGQKGCLEQYFSANGIINLARREFKKSKMNTQIDPKSISAKEIFDLAHYGDFVAVNTVEKACDYLAIALANTAMIVDPEVIVIGGGLSFAKDTLLEPLRIAYKRRALHVNKNVPIILSKLQNDSGMYGAAKLIIDWSDSIK